MEIISSRDNIETKYKWNLSDIYKNWNEWDNDLKLLTELIKEIPTFENNITTDSKKFIKLLKLEEKISRLMDKLYLYPYMLRDLNSKDVTAAEKMQTIEHIYAEYSVSSSWITPKILEIPKEIMDKWIEENKELHNHKFNLNELYRLKQHVLDKDKEKLLSYFSQYMGSINEVYDELSISDIKWNEIELSTGEKFKVSNAVYSKILESYKNQEDRKKAFEAHYNSYFINKNTYAAIYRGQILRDVANMKAKNYNSTLEKALEPDNIPTNVYINLINSAKENSQPLKKYLKLRKKYLNISEYHYYDNQIKIVDYKRTFTYEEAKEIVLNSVKPLGKDYYNNLKTAISEGWLDVFETPNKRSGAYSLNIYDVHPYMLLNFNGTLYSVFTLAHELGHTLHSMYSTKNQPYSTHDYTIFVAEVASTFNEKLLLDYMLNTTTDKNERIALIEEAIGNIVGTYYLQSLFANYEYEAYKLVENGTPITSETLDNIMSKLFKEYFGDELIIDDLQKIVWARIPHFFNSPYYVYQYATSFSASSKLYDKIFNSSESEKEKYQENYLELLKSGGNDFPINQLKKAGVNLEDKENFKSVALEMEKLITLLEKELNK